MERRQVFFREKLLKHTGENVDTELHFPLGHDCIRHYGGSTASIQFKSNGVWLQTQMHQSAPSLYKVSDVCIPMMYRQLFTNIPCGFVPMPVIHNHVTDTLHMIIPLIDSDMRKKQEITSLREELSGHHKRIKDMTTTVEEIQHVLKYINTV